VSNNPTKDKFYTMLNTQIPQAVTFKEATSQQIPVTKFMNDTKKQQSKAQNSFSFYLFINQYIFEEIP
jgi:hypothetical protein